MLENKVEEKKVEEGFSFADEKEVEELKKEQKQVPHVDAYTVDYHEDDENVSADVEEEAKGFVSNVLNFFKTNKFDEMAEEVSKKKKIPKRVVKERTISRVLGTISDVFHIAIEMIEDVFTTVVDLLAYALKKGGSLVCNLARKLVRIFTFNKTCVE